MEVARSRVRAGVFAPGGAVPFDAEEEACVRGERARVVHGAALGVEGEALARVVLGGGHGGGGVFWGGGHGGGGESGTVCGWRDRIGGRGKGRRFWVRDRFDGETVVSWTGSHGKSTRFVAIAPEFGRQSTLRR